MPAEFGTLLEEKTETLAISLDKAVRNALSLYDRLRQIGEKNELAHIYVSFLQSSVLCKLPWLQIDLYDDRDRHDLSECAAEWDVSSVSDRLYHDADELAKKRERIKDYERERLWLDVANQYRIAFEQILPQIISRCPIAQEIPCRWHFGQYLGETAMVWERLGDEIF